MPNNSVEKAKTHVEKLLKQKQLTKKNAKYILEFAETLAARDFSDNRQRKYLYALSKLSRMYNKDFEAASKQDMNKLAAKIRDKYNGETPRDYLVMLRIFIKYIKEQKGTKFGKNEFPEEVSDIEPGSRKYKKMLPTELLTIDEIKQLSEATENLRDRCFVLMLYETGCRIGELIGDENYPGIRLKHIENDKYGSKVTVIGKTGSRVVRLIASAPAISNWLQEHPKRNDKNASLFCGIWTNRGKRIQYRYWNKLLKNIGKKAGIDKPLNPHHFRYSRGSELARYMTESQLCAYLGWEQGSKQARTYVHMAGRDTDDTILSMYGLKKEDKKKSELKPIVCPRCNIKNDPAAKFCSGCSLGLDEKNIMEYDQQKEIATKTGYEIEKLLDNPEFMKQMIDILSNRLEKKMNGK